VTDGTQGVVWINGHCLGRQITNQPPLFVPECWLQANNTIVLVTQGGSAPQGYSLAPVEYHSLVKSPVITTGLRSNELTSMAGKVTGNATVISTGSRLALPPGFAQEGRVSIYDLQGHFLVGNAEVRNGEAVLPAGKTIQPGVFIARSEK
jgi:hypothetical protein